MVIAVTLMVNKHSANHLARIMHKLLCRRNHPSCCAHRLRCATRSGYPAGSSAYRTVRLCGALGRAWRNALRTAFSTPRYKNLCIIRT